MAGPIVAGNVGQIFIGVVDTLMIGRVGVTELGASAFVNNLFWFPMVTLMGLLAAVPVLVSRAKGARDSRLVGRYVKHALLLTLIIVTGVTGLLAINSYFLNGYGQPDEVIAAAHGYYGLIVASLLPALLYQCLKCVSEGLGWSRAPMIVLLLGISLNAFLNWIFIFGNLGVSPMGLEGAGLATLISRWVIVAVLFVYILKTERYYAYLPLSWFRRYELGEFVNILKVGLPTAGQHLFEVGAFTGAGIMVGWLSKEALAANQIALSCASLAFMVPLGISVACGIRVGDAFGSGAFSRISVICKASLGFTLVQTMVTAACFLLFGGFLAGLFVEDETVIEQVVAIFVVVGFFQVFDGTQVTCLGALRGMLDVNVPTGITFVAYWVVALPLGYAFGFPLGFGVVGVWIGLASGLAFAAVCLSLRLWRKMAKKEIG